MRVGFTGTRFGMSAPQKATVRRLLTEIGPDTVIHGDCVGADADFAEIAASLTDRPRIVARPGVSARGGENNLRANSPYSDDTEPAQTHFLRNRDIVGTSDILIATPIESTRQTRGGTWYTVDYAKRFPGRVEVIIVWPDGTTG